MSNDDNNQSVGRTPVTGQPVDVAKAREKEANEKIREKVKERVEDIEEIVRKKYGPPGTP